MLAGLCGLGAVLPVQAEIYPRSLTTPDQVETSIGTLKFRRRQGRQFIQTLPGKGWFVILRLYSPLELFFDKSWKPTEIEESRRLRHNWTTRSMNKAAKRTVVARATLLGGVR